jgi:hypothetical protein
MNAPSEVKEGKPAPEPIRLIRSLGEHHFEGSHGSRKATADLIAKGPPPGRVLARFTWSEWLPEAHRWEVTRSVTFRPSHLRTLGLLMLRAADELFADHQCGKGRR